MKLATSVLLVCLFSAISTQAVDKTQCLLGLQITDANLPERSLQQASRALNVEMSIQNLLVWYPFLGAEARGKIDACKLNLDAAVRRCEAVYGKGACEKATTYAQVKCPVGTTRYGCCVCAKACPPSFTEHELYCYKPASIKTLQFPTQKECETTSRRDCEQWVLDFWVPKCQTGFRRIGSDQCVAMCPEGTNDLGRMCTKSSITRLTAPYTWKSGDN